MRLFSRRAESRSAVQISEKHGVRYLHLGGPAVQSAMRIRDPFALELEYTRAMMLFLLFHPAPESLALIGLGGGSIAKFIYRRMTQAATTAIEINAEVLAAARAFFLLPPDDERLRAIVGDGAAYVRDQDRSFDAVLVDGYDALRIVEDLATQEFYRSCQQALRPGGVAVFNLWGSDRHFETYRDRIEQAFFRHVLILPTEKKGNILLLAFKFPLPDVSFPTLEARARRFEAELGLEFPRFLDRMRSFNPSQADAFRL